MCGIAGILSPNSQLVTKERIKKATDAIAHRGPEGEAYFINHSNTVALGHRRLSIIDLSTAASQPMTYLNRYHIVYNGELYNYLELQQELKKRGFHFFTQSDTEVVVAAYAAYGPECLQQFDGMFAFAIWDEQEQQLFAARDRFGEKPFFFYYDEEQFLFASEIKSLWAAGIPKEINNALLYNFITIGYTSNPADPQETFYQDIYKLPAASLLHYSSKKELVIERYWQIDTTIDETKNEAAAIEEFNHLFTHSVQTRLRSDVPIGTSLSGGLDSSSIVAYSVQQKMAQFTHKCFTAVFPGFEQNEEKQAKLVADYFHLHHYLIHIEGEELVHEIEKIMHHQEEPFTSASIIAQYKVYQRAKQEGVTVLLDGQGADEVLGGYTKYYKWYWQELYAQRKLKRSGELEAAKKLGIHENFSFLHKATALLPQFAAAILQSKKEKQAYQHPGFQQDFAFTHKRSSYYSTPAYFTLNGALYYNTFVNGLEELLRYADRNSSAHAVEVRLPFLNHQLVEALFKLPPYFKIKQGWTKWVLRKSVASKLPEAVVWRKDKVGFEPPQKIWMQNKQVQEAVQEGKRVLVNRGVLKKEVLQKKVQPQDAHAAGNFDWRYWTASLLFRNH